MSLIKYLIAQNNQLGVNESVDSKNENTDSLSYLSKTMNQISYLDLRFNQIRYIDYIKNFKTLSFLFLSNNNYFNYASVSGIASLYTSLGEERKSIDSKYNEYLSTSEYLIYKNLETVTEEGVKKVTYLKNLGKEEKSKVKYLDLSGSQISNEDFNLILTDFNNLIELNCTGCTNLSKLDWVQGKTSLKIFLFNDTGITGNEVSKLDDYATGLRAFSCNNSGINVKVMQKTISRTYWCKWRTK